MFAVETGVETGDEMLKVTERCWFSEAAVAAKPCRFAAIAADPQLAPFWEGRAELTLAFALEVERHNPSSTWRPYFESLPEAYPTQPLFWTAAQLEQLQSPWVVAQINTSLSFLKEQYTTVAEYLGNAHGDVFDVERSTLAAFTWSYYTVYSRVFDVGHPGEPRALSLLPVIDLVNHGFGVANQNVMGVDVPEKVSSFILKANEPLHKGQELLHSYNEHDATLSYLFKYGFVNGDTAADEGDFVLLRTASASCTVGADGAVSASFLAAVAADAASARGAVLRALTAKVDSLPTTLEQDTAALEGSTLEWLGVCLNVRIRFKRILRATALWLSSGQTATSSSVGKRFQGSEAYALLDVVVP